MSLLDPIEASAWNRAKARHLLNRAGFGVPHDRIGTLAASDPESAVAQLLDFESIDPEFARPDFLVAPISYAERNKIRESMDEEEFREVNRQRQRDNRAAVASLRAWWMARMLHSPRPLEEKMTLFWHGHFATSAQKVQESTHNYQLNEVFRNNATGNFRELVTAVGQSPAMLHYLDNRRSTERKPNENWARELMELFTMGEGQYTEEDIKESARAFTGWTMDHEKFVYRDRNHDDGQKTFLGRTGNFDGDDILRIILAQPVTAEFICAKLCAFFAYPDPELALVKNLAATFRENNYEVKPVLRQLFLSEAFYSPRAMATQIKSPAQFMVQLAADLGMEDPPYEYMASAAASLGQNIFYPPNVKGWDGGRAWINANSLLGRYNQPQQLSQAVIARDRKAARPPAKGEDASMMQMTAERESMMMSAKGGSRYDNMTGADPDAPWVMDANTLRRRAEEAMREKLSETPPAERRAKLAAWREADFAAKRKMLAELGLPARLGVATPLCAIFDEIEFSNAAQCIDALAARFLVAPPAPAQRKALIAALGVDNPRTPLDPDNLTLEARQAAVHLITSMAEYQLC